MPTPPISSTRKQNMIIALYIYGVVAILSAIAVSVLPSAVLVNLTPLSESEQDKARAEGFRQGLEIAAVIAEQRDPEKPSNYMHRREQIAAAILDIKY